MLWNRVVSTVQFLTHPCWPVCLFHFSWVWFASVLRRYSYAPTNGALFTSVESARFSPRQHIRAWDRCSGTELSLQSSSRPTPFDQGGLFLLHFSWAGFSSVPRWHLRGLERCSGTELSSQSYSPPSTPINESSFTSVGIGLLHS